MGRIRVAKRQFGNPTAPPAKPVPRGSAARKFIRPWADTTYDHIDTLFPRLRFPRRGRPVRSTFVRLAHRRDTVCVHTFWFL